MHLKLFSSGFNSVDEMVACGIKHSVLADTDNHPFVVDLGSVLIHTLYGVVRYLDARDGDASEYEEKEITASEAIEIIAKFGAHSHG